MIIKEPRGFESWWTSGDHPNDSIIEDGQNTEKSPGDLRRLDVTQTPVKKPSANANVKNSKRVYNNNIKNSKETLATAAGSSNSNRNNLWID